MTFTDPLITRLAVPVLVTVAVAVLVRLIGGAGTRAASIGLPAGFVAGYAAAPGWPWAPPTTPLDQIAWFAVFGALAGLVVDLATRGRIGATILALFWPALAIGYFVGFAWPAEDGGTVYRYGEAAVVLGLLLARLQQIRDTGLSSPVGGAVSALGLGALAWASGLRGEAMLGLVLAAAGLGWVLCNWPNRRLAFGAAGLLGWGGAIMALAAHMALLPGVNGFLVLVVMLALVAEPLARPVVAGNSLTRGEAVAPFALAVLIAIPPAIAVLLKLYAPGLLPSW